MNKYLPFSIICILIFSCYAKQDYKTLTNDPILYCKTVKKLNDVVLQNNFPPMIASRNYVYANIAAYECVVQGDNRFQTLSGQITHMPAMPQADKSKDIDYPLAAMFAFSKVGNAVTFPEGSMMGYYDELKNEAKKNGISSSTLNNTIAFSD